MQNGTPFGFRKTKRFAKMLWRMHFIHTIYQPPGVLNSINMELLLLLEGYRWGRAYFLMHIGVHITHSWELHWLYLDVSLHSVHVYIYSTIVNVQPQNHWVRWLIAGRRRDEQSVISPAVGRNIITRGGRYLSRDLNFMRHLVDTRYLGAGQYLVHHNTNSPT